MTKPSTHVVGGNVDLVIAESSDGRPRFSLQTSESRSASLLYCTAIAEGKGPRVGLSGSPAFSQPVIEFAAMASVCQFPARKIPLIQIYGNRVRFRPILYFKEDDIMITTAYTIQYANLKELFVWKECL